MGRGKAFLDGTATGRCVRSVSPTLCTAATTPRRGHHDDHRDLLPAIYPLRDTAAATVRTLDPAVARLLLGLVRVDNDLRRLTAEQQRTAALARLHFAAQFPEVAAASSKSQQPQSQK